jgi:hypothetical protein
MDKRSITSAENGKKGGRKQGLATIEREKAKDYIAKRIGEYMPELFEVMIEKALKGDIYSIKELFDRAWGKSNMSITGEDGKELIIKITGESASRYGIRGGPTTEPDTDSSNNGQTQI